MACTYNSGSGSLRSFPSLQLKRATTLAFGGVVSSLLLACGSSPTPPPTTAKSASVAEARDDEAGPGAEVVATGFGGETEAAVKASFETSAAELGPGSSFLVAMHFRIADGYRLSWVNPGDMGKEMAIEFKVPDGFEVSAPMFPGPERYDLPDGYVSYGYEGETAVFAEVRVPTDVTPDEVYRFEVSAEWLACKGTCLKEATNAFFELVAADELFDQGFEGRLPSLYDRVPKPIRKLDDASLEWREAGRLAIVAEGVAWKEYFPGGADQPVPRDMSVDRQTGEVVLEFEREALGAGVQGVLLAEVDGKPLYVALDEKLP